MRLTTTLLFATACCLSASAASAQVPGLALSARWTEGDTVLIEPITIVERGALVPLPRGGEDSASMAFRARAYSPGATYWLYSGGRRLGAARAIAATETGCVGLPGLVRPKVALPVAWQGLAATDSTLATATRRRELTGDERASLFRLALADARRLSPGLSPDSLHSTDGWAVDFPDGHAWLLGSFVAYSVADTVDESTLASLVVVEKGSPRPAPPLIWSHLGGETSRQERRALDVLDLDHDGSPELITYTTYYESGDYQIWQLRGGGWIEWAASVGAAGC